MDDPVSGGIWGEGKVSNRISIDSVVKLEEDAEASVRKGGMCRFGENVIVLKTFLSFRESLRRQVLLDGEVGELYHPMASPVDDRDQTGTYGNDRFFWVCWTPIFVKSGECLLVELNRKDLRELFNTKRAYRYHET
jgi:hypothetical protein